MNVEEIDKKGWFAQDDAKLYKPKEFRVYGFCQINNGELPYRLRWFWGGGW